MNSEEQSQQTRQRHRGSKISQKSVPASDLNQNDVALELESDAEDEKSKDYAKEKNKVSGSFTLISVIVLITLTLLFVKYMDKRLPEPLMEVDIADNPKSFIEWRARRDLHTLTSVGVRVSGSEATDVETVAHFINILQKIKETNTSRQRYNLEYQVQKPAGSFFLDDDDGSTSYYSKIANVVAKIEPVDDAVRTGDGILLNCHFDSKPGSPGATDNMISCSVMLEIIRVIYSQPELIIKNTIVFLFNGAEELGLQGAHGFVRGKTEGLETEEGHPWSQNLKVFLNLEGAGAGGREILFQATGGDADYTGWLLKAYKESPYPYGTVLAEEAFQFGLIPSDTDFRIFRDFKGLAGLDLAFIKNGWVYHTKWDRLTEIPPGSIQNMGTNALAMVKYLGNLDFSQDQKSAKEMVFFDVLGSFMITYSKTVGIVINVIIALISIGIIVFFGGWKPKNFLTYGIYILSTIFSLLAAIGVAALVAVMLNGSGYPKPFYTYPSLAVVVFGLPSMITQILAFSICLKSSPKDTWIAGKFFSAILLFVATFITRGAYIFAPALIFGVVGWFSARYLMRGWPRAIMITYLIIGEVIPLMMSSYLIITLSDVFVPILGRAGSEMNGNLFFGLVIAALISFTVQGLVSLFVNYDKRIIFTCLLTSILLLNPMIVFGFLGKIPYLEKTPMRLTICDTHGTWYDANGTERKSEAGYWWWPIDADTDNMFDQFRKTVQEVDDVRDEILDYENCENLYCAQPFIWPTTKRIKKVHWVPKNDSVSPELRNQVQMNIIRDIQTSPTSRILTLEFFGPAQQTVILSPQKNWGAEISIDVLNERVGVERAGILGWKGRKVYYIYHGRGFENEPLRINIDLNRIAESSGGEGSLLEIQHTGLFLDMTPTTATLAFTDFLNRFPSWTFTGMSWSSVMKMYRFE